MGSNLEMVSVPEIPARVYTPPQKRKSSGPLILATLSRLGFLALLSIASYFLFSHFLVQSVQVTGISMVPTLHDGDHYMLNRWAYYFRLPQAGDVVVLRDPEDNGFAIKRIIAKSGESVFLKNGEVYVNGQKLVEPYLLDGDKTPTFLASRQALILFGSNRYFVLGDNRWNSVDSRCYGAVPRKNLLGPVTFQ